MGLYIVKIYPCFAYSSIAVTAQLNLEKFYCLGYGVRDLQSMEAVETSDSSKFEPRGDISKSFSNSYTTCEPIFQT